jgi:hypothetical protein
MQTVPNLLVVDLNVAKRDLKGSAWLIVAVDVTEQGFNKTWADADSLRIYLTANVVDVVVTRAE